jgi:hypothetical protein
MKSNYQYRSPLENGYIQVYLSRKDLNKLFPNRKVKWCHSYEYYYKQDAFRMDRFTSALGKIVNVFLFPFYIIMRGLNAFKRISEEYRRMFNEKKYGAFSSDFVYNTDTLLNISLILARKK